MKHLFNFDIIYAKFEREVLFLEEKTYLELNLPDWLQQSIDAYNDNKESSLWDCYFCELQSDINVCEVENIITSEQAWYLREKYLGITRE